MGGIALAAEWPGNSVKRGLGVGGEGRSRGVVVCLWTAVKGFVFVTPDEETKPSQTCVLLCSCETRGWVLLCALVTEWLCVCALAFNITSVLIP